MASLPTYVPRDVQVSWGGLKMEGFSEDSIISMDFASDTTNEQVSADGKLATTFTSDRTGTVTVELMQNSITNAFLSGIFYKQEKAKKLVKLDFAVTDPSGAVLGMAIQAYIKDTPEISFGTTQNTRVWTFYCEELKFLAFPVGLDKALQSLSPENVQGAINQAFSASGLGAFL